MLTAFRVDGTKKLLHFFHQIFIEKHPGSIQLPFQEFTPRSNPIIFKQTNRNFACIFGTLFLDSFILIYPFLKFYNSGSDGMHQYQS